MIQTEQEMISKPPCEYHAANTECIFHSCGWELEGSDDTASPGFNIWNKNWFLFSLVNSLQSWAFGEWILWRSHLESSDWFWKCAALHCALKWHQEGLGNGGQWQLLA